MATPKIVTGLTKDFSDKTAKKMLEEHLAGKCRILRWVHVVKWEYTDEPFWAITASLFGYYTGIYGFHIHSDGRVEMVGKQSDSIAARRQREDTGC